MKEKFDFRFLLCLMVGIFVSLGAAAQQITVKGHVQDQAGEPVVYATVSVLGTKTVVNTDGNGNFTVNANAGADLRVSYIGYTTAVVKAEHNMLVVLEDNSRLNEAVVIGYGVAKKNDLTGSVTAIKPDEKNKGMVISAQDMMQGKIAGVNVTSNSGAPGEGATIRIRGGSSLNASNNPLYVIDGVALDNNDTKGGANPLSLINPADIETFTVLKDASATAIYGSRGSNGVIIITTKKGRVAEKPRLSYNGFASVSMKRKTLDLMDADEYRNFITSYYGADSEAAKALGTLTGKGTDWQDEIYHLAVSHDHNLTLTGGLKNMPYRVTLGYTDQEGILRTSNYERYTASVNLNPTFLQDHLKFNITGKFMHSNTRFANTDAISASTRMDPTHTIRDYDAKYNNFDHYFNWVKGGEDLNDPTWPYTFERNAVKNPLGCLYQHDERGNVDNFIGNIELDYQIHGLEDLRIHMNAGANYASGERRLTESPMMAGDNTYYGRYGYSQESKYTLNYNAYLQYYKDFNKNHHFDIMGGYEWQHFHYEGDENYYGLYPSTTGNTDEAGNSLAGKRYNEKPSAWEKENYLVSFFGRANYILLDRYLFTATVRYDGSSRFEDHWALFPSFAFGWRIKNEKFLRDNDFFSEMKLRLGYGQTGQQEGIGEYNYFASYTTNTTPDSYYPTIGDGTAYRPDAYNKDLTWETTTTYNAGLDFGIFKGKLSGSVDYYYRKTTDLLNTVYVGAGTNFKNQVTSNIGSLENQGVEVALTYKPISTKDWYWEITANATYNKNEITELVGGKDYYVATGSISAGTGNYCQAHAVGHPAGSFYVYQQVYDENGMPLEGVFVDRNANGAIDEGDKYFYKSPAAPWTAGLSTRLQYKNWDLGLSFRASFNNYVYNDTEASFANIAKTFDNSYGYLQNRPLDAVKMGWVTYDAVLSDYFVQNGSFLKCDNITLGYSFQNLLKGHKYEGVSGRIYATASNVFTITKYKGIDPEVKDGIDNSIYPRPITFMLGLNLNF